MIKRNLIKILRFKQINIENLNVKMNNIMKIQNLNERNILTNNVTDFFQEKDNLNDYLEKSRKKNNLIISSEKIIKLNFDKIIIYQNLFKYYKDNYNLILEEKENFSKFFLNLIIYLNQKKEKKMISEIFEIFKNLNDFYLEKNKFDNLEIKELIKIQFLMINFKTDLILKLKNLIIKINFLILQKINDLEKEEFMKNQEVLDLIIFFHLYWNIFVFEKKTIIKELNEKMGENLDENLFSILENENSENILLDLKSQKLIIDNLKILEKNTKLYNFYLKNLFLIFKDKKNYLPELNFLKDNFKNLSEDQKNEYIQIFDNLDNFKNKGINYQLIFLNIYTNHYNYDYFKRKKFVLIIKDHLFKYLRIDFKKNFYLMVNFLNSEQKNKYYDNLDLNIEIFSEIYQYKNNFKFLNKILIRNFFFYMFYSHNANIFKRFGNMTIFYLEFLIENDFNVLFKNDKELFHFYNMNLLVSKDFIYLKLDFFKKNKKMFLKIFMKFFDFLICNTDRILGLKDKFYLNIIYQFLISLEYFMKSNILLIDKKIFSDLKEKILSKVKYYNDELLKNYNNSNNFKPSVTLENEIKKKLIHYELEFEENLKFLELYKPDFFLKDRKLFLEVNGNVHFGKYSKNMRGKDFIKKFHFLAFSKYPVVEINFKKYMDLKTINKFIEKIRFEFLFQRAVLYKNKYNFDLD